MMAESEAFPHPITGQWFPSPVPPGTGWPGDLATATTAVAADANQVATLAASAATLAELAAEISVCRACPRLVSWREQVAETRCSLAAGPYWGRPIAGWGSSEPKVLVVGLAPAANGSNRTGRIFTGDRAGDWLFAALHRAGLAAEQASRHAGDGQRLIATRIVASVRCAPPANKPTPEEFDTCAPWLDAELAMVLPSVRAIVCLGSLGWSVTLRALRSRGYGIARPRPKFGHGARLELGSCGQDDDRPGLVVLGCFHPSQRNTFTGRLTEPMIDTVLGEAARLAGR